LDQGIPATKPAAHGRRQVAVAFGALVVAAIAMGAGPIFVRLADVGPFASAFWRTLLALPLLWVWVVLERRNSDRPQPKWDWSVVLCGVIFAADLFFWHLSIMLTTVANATFLSTTAPIWVALGAWLLLKEKIGSGVLFGLALCLLGGFALVGQSYHFASERLLGDFYGLVTAIFFGGIMLAVRYARRRYGAGYLAFCSTVVTAIILFVIAFAFEPVLLPSSIRGVAALLALAIISHVGGQGLLSIALGTLPATFSSLVIFIEGIAAAALGWAVLGENIDAIQILGGVLILIGIFVASPRSRTSGAVQKEVAISG
jgi:drug/metabolite transporter (DMT)-like permease